MSVRAANMMTAVSASTSLSETISGTELRQESLLAPPLVLRKLVSFRSAERRALPRHLHIRWLIHLQDSAAMHRITVAVL